MCKYKYSYLHMVSVFISQYSIQMHLQLHCFIDNLTMSEHLVESDHNSDRFNIMFQATEMKNND